MSMTEKTPKHHIVICGGGVIGSSIAYYLATLIERQEQKDVHKKFQVTLIERCEIACASSGKAGGFLALDWCDSSPLDHLARKSFALHEQLSSSLGRDYGYRKLNTLSVSFRNKKAKGNKNLSIPDWIDGKVGSSQILGTTQTTAQVHPQRFTKALIEAAKSKINSFNVRIATVKGLDIGEKDQYGYHAKSLKIICDDNYCEETIIANDVIFALGAWTFQLADWLPKVITQMLPFHKFTGSKVHSIVLKPKNPQLITDHALFTSNLVLKSGEPLSPEIYPRPDGDVYICGISEGESQPPENPNDIHPKESSISCLYELAPLVSSNLADAELKKSQACYLPIPPSNDGLPLIGKIPMFDNLYIASGHTCWGILNSPATGLGIAELVLYGKSKSVNLDPFDPARMMGT